MPGYGETDLPYTSFGWSPLRSLTTPDWKYVRSSRRYLFDRVADPGETTNLAETRPEIAADLDRRLRALEDRMERHLAEELALDEEARERLASLGYVAGGAGDSGVAGEFAGLRDVEEMIPVLDRLARTRKLASQGRHRELAGLYREMLALSPESTVLRRKLAVALIEAGELEAGLDAAADYLRERPEDPEIHHVVGLAHARGGRVREAAGSFLEAIRLDPTHDRAHDAMAMIMERHNDALAAARHRERGGDDMPVEAVIEYDLGVIAAAAGDLDAATRHYEAVLALTPDDLPARYRLASLLEYRGNGEAARHHYREALRLEGADAGRIRQMGITLGETGHGEAAVLFLERAVELDASDGSSRFALAVALQRLGRLDAALGQVDRLLAGQPGTARLRRMRADLLEGLGRLPEAEAERRAAGQGGPG